MKKFLFLTGPHAVGKSYTISELSKVMDIVIFDTGPTMRKIHSQKSPNKKILDWVEEEEKAHGPFITCEYLCNELGTILKDNSCNNVVVIGFRQIEGIEYMANFFKMSEYKVCYFDGAVNLLKANYERREGLRLTIEEFERILADEQEWGLKHIKEWIKDNPEKSLYLFKKANDDTFSKVIREYFES